MIFSCPAKAFPPPPPKIYGVEWDWTSSGPTRGVRTDDAVGLTDPNSAVNNGSGSSPFDNLYPWKDMVRENRTGGVMVKEPKYWFKWTKNGRKLKLQIADQPVDGFHVDPVNMDRGDGLGELDCSYIGRYHCASGTYKSETNKAQQVSITRSQARTNIHNLGSHIWQMDFAQMWYVGMLFLVEFADWNGERIGRGCSARDSKENNGRTDAMRYHTGTTAANRNTYGFTQYRNIEGWWDNVYDWMDGCYCNNNGLNVIKNPAQFSDNANGVLVGKPVGGHPSDFALPTQSGLEWALYPSDAAGSTTTYVPDNWDFNGSYPCLYRGGGYYQNRNHGPFYVYCYGSSSALDSIGCRLQERPPKATGGNLISFTIDGVSYQAEEGMTWGEWLESEYSKDIPKTKPCRNCGTVLPLGFHDSSMYSSAFGYSDGVCINLFANIKDYSKIFPNDRIIDGLNAVTEVSVCNG